MRVIQNHMIWCGMISIFLMLLLFSLTAEGRRGKPPQEAFDACVNKKESDSCAMQTPRGELTGLCRSVPDGMVCAPNRRQGGNRMRKQSNQPPSGKINPTQGDRTTGRQQGKKARCTKRATYKRPSGDQLAATIVGSGSPMLNEARASASVLVSAGKSHLLVDMGNGAQTNLNRIQMRPTDLSVLLFTHHHLDHNEEFIPIFIKALMGKHQFQIIGPPNTERYVESIIELYSEDINYRLGKSGRTLGSRKNAFTVRDIQGGESFQIGDIAVSTLKVPHTIHAIAYRFDNKGKSIVVTGDLTYTEHLSQFADQADFLIMDSGGMIGNKTRRRNKQAGEKQNNSDSSRRKRQNRQRAHVNLAESSKMAADAKVKNLVYTHFVPGEIDEALSLKEIQKNYSGRVIFGKDFQVLSQSNSTNNPIPPNALGTTYSVVDTAQTQFFDNEGVTEASNKGTPFFGQDAGKLTNAPSYTDNADGTISDNVTGLMWQKSFGVMTHDQALQYAKKADTGGFDDWRLPTIKEMYSLILFNGVDASSRNMTSVPDGSKPFIDTDYFDFKYGANGERKIDTQYLSANVYKGVTMGKDATVFGVNMADGRIKGYPLVHPRTGDDNNFTVILVRGNPAYGKNKLVNNRNGTVGDLATGLMWTKNDSQVGMTWQAALAWVQSKNKENYLGFNDWYLPNAKELQSIVDYSRSPQTTRSAAIDPMFTISQMKTEDGSQGFPFFWSSTTHENTRGGANAVYVTFGEALGFMKTPRSSSGKLMDVHGAGAQRSDPKMGDPADYPQGHGPQGDVIRIYNFVRMVRQIN